MSELQIRRVSEDDVDSAIELVMRVFDEFVAQDFPPEGIASFGEWANASAFARRLQAGYFALVAVLRQRIIGVLEWKLPDHIAMLFVDPAIQGEGIGRQLFETGLRQVRAAHMDVTTIHVHASRYAVPFYKRLGFREAGPEQEQSGIRYIPMLLELDK